MAKNLLVRKNKDTVHIEILEVTENQNPTPPKWYSLTRSGLVDAAKTIKDILPIILYILQKLAER